MLMKVLKMYMLEVVGEWGMPVTLYDGAAIPETTTDVHEHFGTLGQHATTNAKEVDAVVAPVPVTNSAATQPSCHDASPETEDKQVKNEDKHVNPRDMPWHLCYPAASPECTGKQLILA